MCTALLATCLLLVVAGARAGYDAVTPFPYYDTCRKTPMESRYEITNTLNAPNPTTGSHFCFLITTRPAAQCIPSRSTDRCCNTILGKIKLYTNAICKGKFGQMTVRNDKPASGSPILYVVSPTWGSPANSSTQYIKWTEFGPISQANANGTSVCFGMSPASSGNRCHTLQGISNSADASRGLVEFSLYDIKKNGYECCPTFAFSTVDGSRFRRGMPLPIQA